MDRRAFLAATSVAASISVTGCSTDGGGGDTGGGETGGGDGETPDGDGGTEGAPVESSDYPLVEEWLTGSEIGGSDDSYDGSIQDGRGEGAPAVDVGVQGNGGAFAFGPSAIAVAPGTTVTWVWTGEGASHNVEAEPGEQLGESDFEFSSGEPVQEAGTEYEFTFDEMGVALYHCEPHLVQGMKGAVVVAE